MPEGLPKVLRPTDQWLRQLAAENSSDLVSFHHKKQIMEKVANAIAAEVVRKRQVVAMGRQVNAVQSIVDRLDRDCCNLFGDQDQNAERASRPPLLRHLAHVIESGNCGCRAEDLVRSRAADVVARWGLEPVTDHTRTLRTWHKTWQENESFEKRILGEARGHHLEMRALRREF